MATSLVESFDEDRERVTIEILYNFDYHYADYFRSQNSVYQYVYSVNQEKPSHNRMIRSGVGIRIKAPSCD